jgi:hypothetical protein
VRREGNGVRLRDDMEMSISERGKRGYVRNLRCERADVLHGFLSWHRMEDQGDIRIHAVHRRENDGITHVDTARHVERGYCVLDCNGFGGC